jgi:hypothetical protein
LRRSLADILKGWRPEDLQSDCGTRWWPCVKVTQPHLE